MRIKISLPVVFIIASGLFLSLGTYLLATKISLHPQLFITTCGEVLKNIQEYVHVNPNGILSSLILPVAFISASLALWQLVRFLISHWRLHQLRIIKDMSENVIWVMNKYSLSNHHIVIVNRDKLTAYTIGLFRPKIVVSQSLVRKLSREQLEAVVLHELYHLRSRHVLWLLLSRLISSLLFFIPAVEYLARQLQAEFELAADAFVVEKQKTTDHLCGSLALNLQYADSVVPHFATSPIEKRIESLTGNTLLFEWIGARQLVVSFLSLSLMLGIAFIQPSQVAADFAFETGGVCSVEKGCQTTDCSEYEAKDTHNFTPIVPASFSLSSSH